MEIEKLREIYDKFLSFTTVEEGKKYPKILTDAFSDDILRRELTFFNDEDGYNVNTTFGEYLIDKYDYYNDVYGACIFYYIEKLFEDTLLQEQYIDISEETIDQIIKARLFDFNRGCLNLNKFIGGYNYLHKVFSDEEFTKDIQNGLQILADLINNMFIGDFLAPIPKITDEEVMTPKEYYAKYKGKFISYKGKLNGYVAGYVEHYLIIGFRDSNGCIKQFSPHVVYDKDYKSYRFSKMKNIIPF